jgi:hypothetical protein
MKDLRDKNARPSSDFPVARDAIDTWMAIRDAAYRTYARF